MSNSPLVDIGYLTFNALAESPGRRGVRIFGAPREQLIIGSICLVLLGFPMAFFVAMIPIWEWFGEITPAKQLIRELAPPFDAISNRYRAFGAPNFPVKRFLVASISLVGLIALSNFAAILWRQVRFHRLNVWVCYDRRKVLLYFCISAVVFFGLWFVLFYDWRVLSFLHTGHGFGQRSGRRIFLFMTISMPFAAAIFAHMATIVMLGALRDARRLTRRSIL
jgi:hypothetical protein